MEKPDWLESVKILSLAPADIVIFKCAHHVSMNEKADIVEKCKRYFDNYVMILSPGLDIEVIAKKDDPQ